MSIPFPDKPVGGQLKYFLLEWEKLTRDKSVLDMVQGMPLDLTDFPVQSKLPHEIKMSQIETEAAQEHIKQLLAKRAIRECPYSGNGFVSNIFLHPKPDGSFRVILNLKNFNKFIEYAHLKMETLNHILDLILPNAFMSVLDLMDAYLTDSGRDPGLFAFCFSVFKENSTAISACHLACHQRHVNSQNCSNPLWLHYVIKVLLLSFILTTYGLQH